MNIPELFRVESLEQAAPLIFAVVLALILIISFRSRAVVFCQYLRRMTGIQLKPKEVRRIYKERGRDGVRELFLDLIIREDLKEGPLEIEEIEAPPPAEKAAAEKASAEKASAENVP